MFKVMVVEDEPPILRNISATIEGVDPEFKVISSCDSGSAAIHELEIQIPDVIFTDIQMSEMDGLTLIRYIREKQYDVEVVVLSGYSEFKYARTALTLGVEDYLLKPLIKSDLAVLLSQLKAKIMKKTKRLQREYLHALLFEQNKLDKPGLSFLMGKAYLLMLFCAGSFPIYSVDSYSKPREFWNRVDLDECIHPFLKSEEAVWVFDGSTSADKIAVFSFEASSAERVAYLAFQIFDQLKNPIFPVNIIYSPFTEDACEVGELLNQVKIKLSRVIIFGSSQIFKPDDECMRSNIAALKLPYVDSTVEKRVMMCIENQKSSFFKKELQNLFKLWESSRFPQIWVEKRLKDLSLQLYNRLNLLDSVSPAALELQISEALSASNNYNELSSNIWYLFEEFFEEKAKESRASDSRDALMMKIDLYIRGNLTEAISNDVLSDRFGLAPSYLSKLFREFKGISPTDYLFHLRIEKAKELIASQPELLTKDIATITGFCDPFHFSKVFKRETGLTPSSYKSLTRK